MNADRSGFDTLKERINPVLRRIIGRIRYTPPSITSEDLYQEAVLHLWNDYNAGRLAEKTDSYVLQGCYFFLKNYLRKCTGRRHMVSIEELVREDGSPVEAALQYGDERFDDLRTSLHVKLLAETICNNGFTVREKEIMRLFAEGLTVREIGCRLGVSHVMIVKLTASIREKSRQYLDQE